MSESVLSLVVDTSGVKSGVGVADSLLSGLGVTALGVAGAVAAVGAALAAFAYKAVDAYSGAEEAESGLRAAIERTGESASKSIPILVDYANEIQKLTKYEDDFIVSQMAQLKNFGVQTAQIKDATKAAIGLAARYGIELPQAIEMLGKASQGQTQTLARYGIVLSDTLTPQQKFNELLTIGAGSFSLAEAQASTFTGRLTQMWNTLGNALEPFGMMIMDGLRLKDVMKFVSESVASVTNQVQIIAPYLMQMINESLGVGNVFEYVANVLRTYVIPYIGDFLVVAIGYATTAINLFRVQWNIMSIAIRGIVFVVAGAAEGVYKALSWLVGKIASIADKIPDWVPGAETVKGTTNALRDGLGQAASISEDIRKSFGDAILDDIGDVSDGVRGIGKSAEWTGKLLAGNLASPLSEIGEIDPSGSITGAQSNTKAQEQKFAGLALQGSVEAYKAEIARVGADDQIATNTQQTAQNTARLVRAVENQGKFALGTV